MGRTGILGCGFPPPYRHESADAGTVEAMTDSPADTVRSVADVATSLRNYIGQLPPVWIEGQLAEWNPRAKAHYGKLKDLVEDASINITVWNTVVEGLTESFKQGDKVRILAKPDYWVGGGSLSFQVRDMRHEGLGDILEKIERLRRTLDAEGLLDGLELHLGEAGLGSVSETADGDAPHRTTGCPFQAWSVAELIRVRRR